MIITFEDVLYSDYGYFSVIDVSCKEGFRKTTPPVLNCLSLCLGNQVCIVLLEKNLLHTESINCVLNIHFRQGGQRAKRIVKFPSV